MSTDESSTKVRGGILLAKTVTQFRAQGKMIVSLVEIEVFTSMVQRLKPSIHPDCPVV